MKNSLGNVQKIEKKFSLTKEVAESWSEMCFNREESLKIPANCEPLKSQKRAKILQIGGFKTINVKSILATKKGSKFCQIASH